MKTANPCILTINGGSSSIRFALYQTGDPLKRGLYGKVDRIGLPGTILTFHDPVQSLPESRSIEASDHRSAAAFLIDWLEEKIGFASVTAVGHRVVHGMNYTEPQRVTQELMDELHRISPYDPDHLPAEIELIEAFRQRHPKLSQVACFDTAFHRTMPRVARLLPIPRRFDAMGIQRYGFHGLSYAYLVEELDRVAGPAAAQGRVILAHLGNGASLAAIHEGKSIDTSMGFTPAAGLPMGTRTGDLDPGVAWYMMRSEKLTPKQFNNLINHESGLLGVSGIQFRHAGSDPTAGQRYPRRRSRGTVLLPDPQMDRGVRSCAWRFGHARVCRRHRRERGRSAGPCMQRSAVSWRRVGRSQERRQRPGDFH